MQGPRVRVRAYAQVEGVERVAREVSGQLDMWEQHGLLGEAPPRGWVVLTARVPQRGLFAPRGLAFAASDKCAMLAAREHHRAARVV